MTRPQLATEVGWEHLSGQQRKFAETWVRTHHMRQSLDAAGYAYDPERASNMGKRVLRRCKRYVDYLEAAALKKTVLSIEAVQLQMHRLGYSNPYHYYTVMPSGKKRPKTLEELNEDEAAAIQDWEFTLWKDEVQGEIMVVHVIKLHDKRGPLQDLMKSMGGMPTGRPGEVPPAPPPNQLDLSGLSPEEVRALDKAFKLAEALINKARNRSAITVSGAGATSGDTTPSGAPTPLLPSGSGG